MGYLLLWLFALGACVSWLAAALATPTRDSSLFARIVLRLFLASPALGAAGFLIYLVYGLRAQGYIHAGDAWLVYIVLGLLAPIAVVFLCQRWWRRAADSREVEQKAIRRRTVAALYGLALLCAALHVCVAWIQMRAVTGVVEAEMAVAQATLQTYLDADRAHWEPILAARDPDVPQDFTAAYKEFDSINNTQINPRISAMLSWMGSWHNYIHSQGRSRTTYVAKLGDWYRTSTPEDQIEETLPETLARFQPEIEELRALTANEPYKVEFVPACLTTWSDDDPAMALLGLAQALRVDSEGALDAGDRARSVRDLQAIANLSNLAVGKGATVGLLISLGCRDSGHGAAEAYLSAEGLTKADLDALPIGGKDTWQSRVARCNDEEYYFDLYAMAETAHGRQSWVTAVGPDYPLEGYEGWLCKACIFPTSVADVRRVREEWLPLLTPLYWQTRVRWAERPSQMDIGHDGLEFWNWMNNILAAAVKADVSDDLLRVGRAAALYKIDHGLYPAQLDALMPDYLPALPVDRFTGKALLFRVEDDGQGLVIWSVGTDGEDNGAALEEECEHNDTDITLFLGESYRRAAALAQKNRQERTANN